MLILYTALTIILYTTHTHTLHVCVHVCNRRECARADEARQEGHRQAAQEPDRARAIHRLVRAY